MPVEEHLLAREDCRERLAGWDECLRAMRPALRKLTASVPSVGAWRSRSPDDILPPAVRSSHAV
jgi:hypothetical protein